MAQQRVGVRNGALFNPTSTLWNNLLAYYTADNTPNDALGNYNGTLVNGTTYGTGKINQGFSFDGVNDYVDMGDVMDLGLNSRTFNVWIYNTSNLSQNKTILGKTVAGPTIGRYFMALNANNKLLTLIHNGPTIYQNDQILLYGNTTIPINTWTMVTYVIDRNSGLNMYINGVQETYTVKDGFGNIRTNDLTPNTSINYDMGYPFRIGSYTNLDLSGSIFFKGLIDEVGIWNRVLTPTEITELYNSGVGKQYPN